ncbi:S-methyl-5-thioribose-1-phosphate isomerase [Guyparkeria halophila]|uniref:S-methyl-5-thioribose-1-phosphate isomerase n=1 Tax=Guyparkeria halophila TaxID=47960 RepID=UPI001E59B77B|nr:S-methyl-5-thioribose-1-phosphate isomerase [Guyparkeria halophila]
MQELGVLKALKYKDNTLRVLDQRRLPNRVEWICCTDATCVAKVIREMAVRGAPAIGVAAAYGYLLAARSLAARGEGLTVDALQAGYRELAAARPTAVNLVWALDRMVACLRDAEPLPDAQRLDRLSDEAQSIEARDVEANLAMSQRGAALIERDRECGWVLTHCNTGALATAGQGTALGVIRDAWSAGRIEGVYVDETRPWLQGSRLTAWELQEESIDYRLICDGAAASVLATGRVGWVIVGADRIAANGDTANKIGTYSLAVLARHHGVKFMVVAPRSTIDRDCRDGSAIEIEQRPAVEVSEVGGQLLAPRGASVYNPAFDVTPAGLIDALVTEAGVVRHPDRDSIARLFD